MQDCTQLDTKVSPVDPPVIRKTCGLLEARKQKNLSLDRLAQLSGIHYQSIWRIANGRRMPRIDTARQIAKSLDLSVDQLIFPAEVPPERRSRQP